MQLFDVYPLQDVSVSHAGGSYVWDENGTRYLDLYGGHAVISIGHSHPHYIHRITEQLGRIGFYSNSVKLPIQEELASLLGEVSGKNSYRLFLCNSGAEANENALKLASFHTGRKKVVAFTGAFHGRTSLAVSVTDNPKIRAAVNETDCVQFLPFNDVAALENWFQKEGEQTAAVIVESIQGVAGIRLASVEFLQAIRRLCSEWGSVFIADEVQAGYGRSGHFFATDASGVEADIYTMAKGMGNGFPVAGILIAPYIEAKHGMLGTTFGGNPLACAAALAVLEVMRDEILMENATRTGEWLRQEMALLPGITSLRGRGLMIGFDVAQSSQLRQSLLHRHHIFTGASGTQTIRLLPALNLQRDDARFFLDALRQELSSLNERDPSHYPTLQNA